MKKLFLSLAVVMSVSLFSCGNSNSTETADTIQADTVATLTEEVVETVDSTNVAPADSTVAPADSTVAAN